MNDRRKLNLIVWVIALPIGMAILLNLTMRWALSDPLDHAPGPTILEDSSLVWQTDDGYVLERQLKYSGSTTEIGKALDKFLTPRRWRHSSSFVAITNIPSESFASPSNPDDKIEVYEDPVGSYVFELRHIDVLEFRIRALRGQEVTKDRYLWNLTRQYYPDQPQ